MYVYGTGKCKLKYLRSSNDRVDHLFKEDISCNRIHTVYYYNTIK